MAHLAKLKFSDKQRSQVKMTVEEVVHPLRGTCAARQFPVRPDEMAGIAVWKTLQIILMFRLGFPEVDGRCQFGHHFSGPEA